jgi:endonuclease YncB( thermonuclease family)
MSALLTALLLASAPVPAQANAPLAAALQTAEPAAARPPAKLYDVVRVVDGDTLHIDLDGVTEKLRLLSVDTEERLHGNPNASPTKPETMFGEECALWAQEFFAGIAEGDAPPKVGLRFPPQWNGVGRRDVYGRLLCDVVLPDGRDFNVLLVELGKSPYFNKYGNSTICHAEFVAAQKRARAAKRGIWDPRANEPATPGAPAAKRPYPELLSWWQARADAIDAFRARAAKAPERCADAEEADSMARAFAACAADAEVDVEVFGSVDRIFDERDGAVTVLFRTGAKDDAFRAVLPKDAVAGDAGVKLRARIEQSREEFRQNYWSVRGRLGSGGRGGWTMRAGSADQWTLAGPEPELPAPKTSAPEPAAPVR